MVIIMVMMMMMMMMMTSVLNDIYFDESCRHYEIDMIGSIQLNLERKPFRNFWVCSWIQNDLHVSYEDRQ